MVRSVFFLGMVSIFKNNYGLFFFFLVWYSAESLTSVSVIKNRGYLYDERLEEGAAAYETVPFFLLFSAI